MGRAGRRRWVAVGFMAVWLTLWTAGILVAVWHLGAQAIAGEPAAAVFLAVWIAAALLALGNGGRRLLALLLDEKAPPRPHGDHAWRDGIDDAAPSGQPASSAAATRDSAAGR